MKWIASLATALLTTVTAWSHAYPAPDEGSFSLGANYKSSHYEEGCKISYYPGISLSGEAAWNLLQGISIRPEMNFRYNTPKNIEAAGYSFELDGSTLAVMGAMNVFYTPTIIWENLSPYVGVGIGAQYQWTELEILPVYTQRGWVVFDTIRRESTCLVPQYALGCSWKSKDGEDLGIEFRHRFPLHESSTEYAVSCKLGKTF